MVGQGADTDGLAGPDNYFSLVNERINWRCLFDLVFTSRPNLAVACLRLERGSEQESEPASECASE